MNFTVKASLMFDKNINIHVSKCCPVRDFLQVDCPVVFLKDRQHRGADRQTGQRGLAGPAGPGAGPPHPHQREGGAAEGAAVYQPTEAAGAQRCREAGDGEETPGERPAGCQRQPEQGAVREASGPLGNIS